jgi:hypothetical protein
VRSHDKEDDGGDRTTGQKREAPAFAAPGLRQIIKPSYAGTLEYNGDQRPSVLVRALARKPKTSAKKNELDDAIPF